MPWLECDAAGGDERRHRAGLGDAFFQNLPVLRLAVVEHGVGIDRLVELAGVRVDAELAEERLHAERAGFVGHDRHDVAADVLVAHQPGQQPHEGHRGRDLAALAAGEELGIVFPLRRLELDRGRAPARHESAQRLAPPAQILHLGAVVRRLVELGPAGGLVGNRNVEPPAELDQFLLVELLLLMGDVAAFAGLAQAVALDRLGQDDGRRTLVLDGRLVGGIDFGRIVPAALQPPNLLVAQVGHHRLQPRIDAEEVLADVVARADDVFLILPIDHLAHPAHQHAVGVLGQQRVPVGAPDHLDDVPAGAAERAFQLLNDLAVAAHRAVEPLEVAVDDEDQVVELFAGGQRDGARASPARRIRRRPGTPKPARPRRRA